MTQWYTVLSMMVFSCSSLWAMQPGEQAKKNKLQTPLRSSLRNVNTYINLKTLGTRIIDIIIKLIGEDEISMRDLTLLCDALQENKLIDLERNGYINLKKLALLQSKAKFGLPLEKSDILGALSFNKFLTLFGSDEKDILTYINPDTIISILCDHYIKEGELKSEVMLTLIENKAIDLEQLPKLLKENQLQTLQTYFHLGKVLKLLVIEFNNGKITQDELLRAFKIDALLRLIEIDPTSLGSYVEQEAFATNCLSLCGSFFNGNLDRKQVLVALQKSVKGLDLLAHLLKIEKSKIQRYVHAKEFEKIAQELADGKKLTRERLLRAFNMQQMRIHNIDIAAIEHFININEFVSLLNDIPTNIQFTPDRILRPFNLHNIENSLYLPQGLIRSLLDSRIPPALQQQNLALLQERLSTKPLEHFKENIGKGLHVHFAILLSMYTLCQITSYLPFGINPNSSKAVLGCMFMSYFFIRLAEWYFHSHKTSLTEAIAFNTFWPAIVHMIFPENTQQSMFELLAPGHPLYEEFKRFCASLRQEQYALLNPPYILALAVDKPEYLDKQHNFKRSLDNRQLGDLAALREQHKALRRLDPKHPNYISLCNLLTKLFIADVNTISEHFCFIVDDQKIEVYNPWLYIQKNPSVLVKDRTLNIRITQEQLPALNLLLARSVIFEKLNESYNSFTNLVEFIDTLSLEQINLVPLETWVELQNNPQIILNNDRFMKSLNSAQSHFLRTWIQQYS